MSLAKVMIPSLRVMQARKKEKKKEVSTAERYEDLEGLDEKRKEAQEHSRRYRQMMTKAYGRTIKEKVFAKRQLVLRIAYHIK